MAIILETKEGNWPSPRDFVNMFAQQVAGVMATRIPEADIQIDLVFSWRNCCTHSEANRYNIEVVFKAEHWGDLVFGFGQELAHALSHSERLSNKSNWCNEALSHALGVESLSNRS